MADSKIKDVIIDQTKESISVELYPQSMHIYVISVTVLDSNKQKISGPYYGVEKDKKNVVDIPDLKPNNAKGKFLSCLISIVSPTGDDKKYKATVTVVEDGTQMPDNAVIEGMTSKGEASEYVQFCLI